MEAKLIDITFSAAPLSAQSDSRPTASRNPTGSVDDGELTRRLADGEADALALIYERHAAALYRLLCALLGSPTDAEDALQEVFVKLAGGRLGRIRDLRSYLFVAARHQALSTLRRRKRESQLEDDHLWQRDKDTTQNAAVDAYDWPQMLAQLPFEQREVIALKVWEQMTFAEVAAIVGASPNTVASRYRYGIERLRTMCREENADES